MSQSNEAEKPDQDPSAEEWVPEDDAIIGKAFRGSLYVIGITAVIALLLWLFLKQGEEIIEETSFEATAPETVVREVTPPAVTFSDITEAAGIRFTHVNGATGQRLLPETMGGGVAFFDADNDGDQDLFFLNGKPWDSEGGPEARSALYLNDGTGKFTDASKASGLDLSIYGMGVAVGDYDADGDQDLFITAVGSNRLLRNEGKGRFEDVTEAAGVAGEAKEWSTSAGFVDFDNDGYLDLFVCNYVRWSPGIDLQQDYRLVGIGRAYGPPQDFAGTYPYLYRNLGNGSFEDVSAESGIQVNNPATGKPAAKALALAPADVDQDGWIDLLVANDTVANFFYHNRGGMQFEENGEYYGLAYGSAGNATGAMGIDSGYFRNDHNLGFMIGNFANEMTSVYVGQDDPLFYVDTAISEGIGAPSRRALTFGLFLFDYDLDRRLDMLQINGHVENEIARVDPSQSYKQAAQLFWNAGNEHSRQFIQVDNDQSGDLGVEMVGRGAAYADIDDDGDLDMVFTQISGPAVLLRNDQQTGHNWIRVKLVNRAPNIDAIGAWVVLKTDGVVQRRQVMPTRSYISQVELPLTFGLGDDEIESLKVIWPDGEQQAITPPAANQELVIRRPL